MILFLIHFFQNAFHTTLPAVFGYYSTRMMLAALTSLVCSIFLGPHFIKKLYDLKIGQTIRTAECAPLLSELHKNKKNTPTMGGILILSSMLISLFLWMDLTHIFTIILFFTTIGLGFLGAQDDYKKLKYKNSKGVSGKKKLLVQGSIAGLIALYLLSPSLHQFLHIGDWYKPPVVKEQLLVKEDLAEGQVRASTAMAMTVPFHKYASRIYVPFLKNHVVQLGGLLTIVSGLFIVFVITGASNAVNLTDGLDGLAAGCLLMVSSCLALIAFLSNNLDLANYLHIPYIEGSGEIAIYLAAFAGACLGFLWYNGHPAQVFMGDTGSLALGGIIGVSAVLLKREFLLAIIGGIFVAEALSVILQVASFRLRNKKRIFLCAPLHHHFEYKGWPETKVVLRFWIVGLLLAILGLASLKFQ
jgi:phospho-N-acetylmuramoyl-pentapeptide-transferase